VLVCLLTAEPLENVPLVFPLPEEEPLLENVYDCPVTLPVDTLLGLGYFSRTSKLVLLPP